MTYYSDHNYLARIPWRDGVPVYCRQCDSSQAMVLWRGMLTCPHAHQTHPAQALVSGELS